MNPDTLSASSMFPEGCFLLVNISPQNTNNTMDDSFALGTCSPAQAVSSLHCGISISFSSHVNRNGNLSASGKRLRGEVSGLGNYCMSGTF